MHLANFSTGVWWIVFFMGAAWAAPTAPFTGTQPKIECELQIQNVTGEYNRTESAVPGEAECQTAWQKFMIDFGVHYPSEAETQKRQSIFCANWQGIQEHNDQYEAGKVSFKKKINQWADLTFEEWKNKQRPILKPEFAKTKPTTEASEVAQKSIKCEDAWQKFLIDFNRKYENYSETEKRRSIFCNNWQRIQEHNAQYEAGKISHKKGINQWSDLTFEEWREKQKPHFLANTEEPGTYAPKPILEEQPVEVPSHIEELEEP